MLSLIGASALTVLAGSVRHAEHPAAVLLHRRHRHGAVRTGLAGFGRRAGATGGTAGRRGAEWYQLQYRAQFRPAIGGIVVATSGAVAAFAVNAVLYMPLLMVLFLRHRVHELSRLPRERLSRAMVSGVRYIANSPSIKIVLTRTLVTGIFGGSVSALMPLVARDLLHGGAQTYGVTLGAFGMGAVIGAMNMGTSASI